MGFISDLPHQLVAAFRATLEEVLEADLIVHVRDIAHPEAEAQKAEVLGVLETLGVGEATREGMLELRNKIDLLAPDEAAAARAAAARESDVLAISAADGTGVPEILAAIEDRLYPDRERMRFVFAPSDGAAISWLYAHAAVCTRRDTEVETEIEAELTPSDLSRFQKRFGPGHLRRRRVGLAAE